MKTISIYNEKKAKIAPDMTGLFFEDINYAADGGLYAELIENRNFEFVRASGHKTDYYTEFDGTYGWTFDKQSDAKIVCGSPVAEENPHYLRFSAKKAGAGFSNKAYSGITIKEGMKYNVSFYARNVERIDSVTVEIIKKNKVYAQKKIALLKQKEDELCIWKKYCVELSGNPVRGAEFKILLDQKGTVEFDFISMIPQDAVAGIFRKDLFDLLKEMEPGFMRFPGGCIIEGNTLSNRYKFKETLKPLEHRRSNWNRWAVHGNDDKDSKGNWKNHSIYDHYNQTYGIGYYEFFLLCELLGAKPLPVLNVGLACQYQSLELAEIGTKEFDEYLEDALDLIEFATGDSSTKWGAVRKELGHEKPFNLEMLGIGNEQWETEKSRFFERYTIFEKTIHAKYPQMKLIGSAGPDITSEKYSASWDFINKNAKEKDNFVYAVDEHYYVHPDWLLEHVNFYDNYDRKVKVFSGEYAAHIDGSRSFNNAKINTLQCALAEAAFLTGVERNADEVVLASYAPLFARIDWTQWSPDLIWFDDSSAYGTPSYYVQKMYSKWTGTVTLDTKGEQEKFYSEGIYYNPSLDEATGKIYLKIVNVNDEDVEIEVNDGKGNFLCPKEIYCLGGKEKGQMNSIESPENIKIYSQQPDKKIVLPKNSFSIIVF